MPATLEIQYPPFPSLEGEDEDEHASPIDHQHPPQPHTPTHLNPPVNPSSRPDPTPQTFPPRTIPPTSSESTIVASPLNNIPSDISLHRALLFALDTPVQLTPAVWSRFWPFIDNVWCLHQRPIPNPSTGISKVYGGCRLNRKTNFPPPVIHENSRPRQRREGGTCKAKFRLTVYPDGRRVVERTGEQHSHTLEYIDGIKRNTGVRSLVLDDFFKSWEAGGILAFLRDTSTTSTPSRDILRDAGGLYLSRQEVQNILNSALKRAYPHQDVSTIKKQMDKYKNYTTCNYRGCDAQAFQDIKSLMEHRKSVHGLRVHDHSDKVYACPDKSCWRRKRSKGFATVLGLEGHIREKHGDVAGELLAKGAGLGMRNGLGTVAGVVLGGVGSNSSGGGGGGLDGGQRREQDADDDEQMDGDGDEDMEEEEGEDAMLDRIFNQDPSSDMNDDNGTPLNLDSHLQSNLISHPTFALQDPCVNPVTPDSSTEDGESSHQSYQSHEQSHDHNSHPNSHSHPQALHHHHSLPSSSTSTSTSQAQALQPSTEMGQDQPQPLSHTEKEFMKLRIQRLKIEREKLDGEIRRLEGRIWEGEGKV